MTETKTNTVKAKTVIGRIIRTCNQDEYRTLEEISADSEVDLETVTEYITKRYLGRFKTETRENGDIAYLYRKYKQNKYKEIRTTHLAPACHFCNLPIHHSDNRQQFIHYCDGCNQMSKIIVRADGYESKPVA